jgi:hypothetical protein
MQQHSRYIPGERLFSIGLPDAVVVHRFLLRGRHRVVQRSTWMEIGSAEPSGVRV